MTYYKLIGCIEAIRQVSQLKLPIKKARDVYDTINAISGELDFYLAEENKLAEQFGIKDDNGIVMRENNMPLFDETNDNRGLWEKAMHDLQFTESKYNSPPVIITDSELGTQVITVSWIESLKGIIEFKEE